MTFRDDGYPPRIPIVANLTPRLEPIGTPIERSGSINLISPHNYWRDVQASGRPSTYSGWFDGRYAHAAIKRFLTVSPRAVA